MSNRKRRERNRFQAAALIVFVVLLSGLGYWYWYYRPTAFSTVVARFRSASGEISSPFHLEVVATEADRAKGLMFRKRMPADHGMLFVFPTARRNQFWMRNTFIPLDMVFLDNNWQVVGLIENVPILQEKPQGVDKLSIYVIELNAGIARKTGIKVGSKAEIEGVVPVGS